MAGNKSINDLVAAARITEIQKEENDKYQKLIDQAEKDFEKNKNEEAIKKYERALTIKPNDPHCKERIEFIKKKSKPAAKPETPPKTEGKNDNDLESEDEPNDEVEEKTKNSTQNESNESSETLGPQQYLDMYCPDERDLDSATMSLKISRDLHQVLKDRIHELQSHRKGMSIYSITNNVVRHFLRETDEMHEKLRKKTHRHKPY